jgi:hypothetical protein
MGFSKYFGEVSYQYTAMDAAKQLGYGDEVVNKIRAAKSDAEIERIMVTAREQAALKEWA